MWNYSINNDQRKGTHNAPVKLCKRMDSTEMQYYYHIEKGTGEICFANLRV